MALTQYVRQEFLRQRANASFAIIQANSVPQQPNSHFISYLLSFVCIALILTHSYQLYHRKKKRWSQILNDRGDFFSPWCLTIAIWAGDILLYFLQGTLDPIGPQFVLCFILWLATFLPTSFIAYWLCRDDNKPIYKDHKKPIDISLYAFYFLMFLSLLMTLLYAKAIYGIVSQFDDQNMLFNIRVLTLHNTESFGLLAHTQGLNLALFLVAIWLYPRISGWTVFFIVVMRARGKENAELVMRLRQLREFIYHPTPKELLENHLADENYYYDMLQYALAFGAEESWAISFLTLNVPEPNWFSHDVEGYAYSNIREDESTLDYARDLKTFMRTIENAFADLMRHKRRRY